MVRASVAAVLLVTLVVVVQRPSPTNALLDDITGFLSPYIKAVNTVLKVAIKFPFTPANLRERLQTLSTALENRDFATAITEIRDLITSKLRFLKGLIKEDDLQSLVGKMESIDMDVKNMTSMIADSMDKEMKSMAPVALSSLPDFLGNKIRPIISKIRNITSKVEGLAFTPDIIKGSLRKIRDALEEDNVLNVISGIRNVVKSGIRSILSSSSNSLPQDQMSELENEFESIRAQTMALQLRTEEVQEQRNSLPNRGNVAMMSFVTVLGASVLSHIF